MDEAVFKCESSACLFPFRNFKYKNYVDRTIFRYERVMKTDELNLEEKIFTSPTKVESDDMDNFNLSWLDHSFTTESDLDSILTAPSDGASCDIKEIINNICNSVDFSSKNCNSPSKSGNELQLSTVPAPKLSKCLKYIEHLSPTKIPSNKVKTSTPFMQNAHNVISTSDVQSLKTNTKCNTKNLKLFKKNREIRPVKPFIMEQRPLDWLNVVSKIEPEKIHEFEFTLPTPVSENCKKDLSNNNEKSFDPPILVEFMGTSTSYILDGNQLTNDNEPCISYEVDYNELQATQNGSESNEHLKEPITSQTVEDILLEEQISTATSLSMPTISQESSNFDFQIVKTKFDLPSLHKKKTVKIKSDQEKEEEKLKKASLKKEEREKRKIEKKILKQQLRKEILLRKRMEAAKANTNKKSVNIEEQDIFRGFDALEPFKPITLQTKPLVWL